MVLRYAESTGSSANDSIAAVCSYAVFGENGNDVINGIDGDNQLCIGGTGTNTYNLIPSEIMTVLSINGANEVISAPAIDLHSKTTYWGTVNNGKDLFFIDTVTSEGVIVVNDYRTDTITETFKFGGSTYSYNDVLALAKSGGGGSTFVGDSGWSGAFILANGFSVADNTEAWKFYAAEAAAYESVSIPTDMTQTVQTYFQAILRAAPSASDISTALSLVSSGSLQSLTSSLLAKAAPTTGAALLLFDFINGKTPDSTGLDSLATTAKALVDQAGGNANASWQQLGASLTDSKFNSNYQTKYAALSTDTLISTLSQDIFGSAPSDFAKGYFQNLVSYYQGYYSHFADSNDPSGLLRAKGTLIGDMLKQAMDANVGKYPAAEVAFLTAAATGTASYGADILGTKAAVVGFADPSPIDAFLT